MLNYDNILQKALEAIPEFKTKYEDLIKRRVLYHDSGMHIVFAYAFEPLLEDAIRNKNEMVIKVCFDFIEQMCSASDHLVVEVCDQSILEALNDEFDEKTLRPLMGKNTKDGYNAIKRFFR